MDLTDYILIGFINYGKPMVTSDSIKLPPLNSDYAFVDKNGNQLSGYNAFIDVQDGIEVLNVSMPYNDLGNALIYIKRPLGYQRFDELDFKSEADFKAYTEALKALATSLNYPQVTINVALKAVQDDDAATVNDKVLGLGAGADGLRLVKAGIIPDKEPEPTVSTTHPYLMWEEPKDKEAVTPEPPPDIKSWDIVDVPYFGTGDRLSEIHIEPGRQRTGALRDTQYKPVFEEGEEELYGDIYVFGSEYYGINTLIRVNKEAMILFERFRLYEVVSGSLDDNTAVIKQVDVKNFNGMGEPYGHSDSPLITTEDILAKTFIFVDANKINEDYKDKQWVNMLDLYSEFKLTDVDFAINHQDGAENYKKFTPRRLDGSIIYEGYERIKLG